MAANLTRGPDQDRFQFNLRTLLIVVTSVCVLFGILAWLLPIDLPIEYRIAIYVLYGGGLVFASWMIYRQRRRPWQSPANYVMVKVDARWEQRAKSPLVMGSLAALTGVRGIAPLYLFLCGQVDKFGIFEWIVVPLCFLIVFCAPEMIMKLGWEVLAEIYKSETTPDGG